METRLLFELHRFATFKANAGGITAYVLPLSAMAVGE